MENYNEYPEMQEMRQQIGLLKQKLEQQSIVNERLLKRVMSRGVSTLNRMGRFTMLMCFVMAVPCAAVSHKNGLSLWFAGFTVLMMLFSGTMTWLYHRELWSINLSTTSLVELAGVVSRLKQRYVSWLRVVIPILCFWVAWMLTEAWLRIDTTPTLRYFMTGALCGLPLGLFIGNRRRRKVICQADEVLRQIDELKQEGNR